jgi:cyclohexa-1,5-dienecarbonyl-CoA hydratase
MTTNDAFEHIVLEHSAGVVRLVLNRPPLNVLNIKMLNEINEALRSVTYDLETRLLIITGSGKAFSAGVDVGEHLPETAEEMLSVFQMTYELLSAIEIPTLAVVNGVALGGGCELAVLCDLVLAAESAKLGQPEIRLATIAPIAAAVFPRLCGTRKTLELLLTGESISASEAARIGLITRAVADDRLQDEVEKLTQKLLSLSPQALRAVKRSVLDGTGRKINDAVDHATGLCLEMLLHSHDSEEGLRAFLEKRRPMWAGR